MAEIGTALVTINYTGKYRAEIEKALQPSKVIWTAPGDTGKISEALKTANIALLDGDVTEQITREGKNLKWIHCNHAGVNQSAKPEIFERGIILSCSAGRSGPVLAEHVFYLLLSLVYVSRTVEEQQRAHVWRTIYDDKRGLFGKTMGIIGLGFTGKEVAQRAKAFGMRVIAYDRAFDGPPANADEFYSADKGETVEPLLAESDVVVLSCRLSDETYHLINERAFGLMKNTALLINMARGAVVDEGALAKALKDGTIAGAGSDVFTMEPLGADSPLWDLPNMVITPHCTPEMPDMPWNCVEIIKENISKFRAGEFLRNQQTARDVYTKQC
jgi:phosphoglycerate dehydrogenase-like enzyme